MTKEQELVAYQPDPDSEEWKRQLEREKREMERRKVRRLSVELLEPR